MLFLELPLDVVGECLHREANLRYGCLVMAKHDPAGVPQTAIVIATEPRLIMGEGLTGPVEALQGIQPFPGRHHQQTFVTTPQQDFEPQREPIAVVQIEGLVRIGGGCMNQIGEKPPPNGFYRLIETVDFVGTAANPFHAAETVAIKIEHGDLAVEIAVAAPW